MIGGMDSELLEQGKNGDRMRDGIESFYKVQTIMEVEMG